MDKKFDIARVTNAVKEHRFVEALSLIEGNLAHNPNHKDSLYLGAVCSRYLKNYEDAKKYSREILDLGVKNVVVTLGDLGVYFENNSDNHFEPALELGQKVIDTSGAGDAFNGSFATALCENKNILEAIKFANVYAGISTTRIGTANSMPERDEIEKML